MLISSQFRWLRAIAIATVATTALSSPSQAAAQVILHYPPLKDFTISVNALEQFAKYGKVDPDFAPFVKQSTPAQLQQFRQYLQKRYAISPIYVSQFTNAPLVSSLFERLGNLIQGDRRKNGSKFIRTALIRAATDKSKGLTVINFLRQFPGRQININVNEGFATYANLTNLLKQRDAAIVSIDRIAQAEATTEGTDFTKKFDLRQAGKYQWQKRSFDWIDRSRQRHVPGDLYLPQTIVGGRIPLIVISHGVAEDRTALAYLAQHLASYGFAVAAIEHVGGDANRFRKYFSGLAPAPSPSEFLDRPRDISFLLDELQRQAYSDPSLRQLNLTAVGAIGHSLGGYTTLALAGAELDFDRIDRFCNPNRLLNLSSILQCRAKELTPKRYALQDPRIAAIFAINPIGNVMFGAQGIGRVRVPTMLVGGSDDLVAPAVPEQIYPFVWLQTANKYLAIIDRGTHFSAIAVSKADSIFPTSDELIGPNPEIARTYIDALSVAFFETHLANRSEFRPYLSAAYAKLLTESAGKRQSGKKSAISLDLVQASASAQITQMLDRSAQLSP